MLLSQATKQPHSTGSGVASKAAYPFERIAFVPAQSASARLTFKLKADHNNVINIQSKVRTWMFRGVLGEMNDASWCTMLLFASRMCSWCTASLPECFSQYPYMAQYSRCQDGADGIGNALVCSCAQDCQGNTFMPPHARNQRARSSGPVHVHRWRTVECCARAANSCSTAQR